MSLLERSAVSPTPVFGNCDRRLNGGTRLVPVARQNIDGIFPTAHCRQALVPTRRSADVLLHLVELNRGNSANMALPASCESSRPIGRTTVQTNL